MSRRTHTWNAYETILAGPLVTGATSVAVDSALGLTAPVYLVFDPDVPSKREWIRVNTINSNNLENLVRNQEGSVGDVDHDAGAIVRAVFSKQHLDDLFLDSGDNETALQTHIDDTGDPHAAAEYLVEADGDGFYIRLDGTTVPVADIPMGANKITGVADPTLAQDASTMAYTDAAEAAANVYSDGLDHDHDTPIEAHNVAAGRHTAQFDLYLPLAGGTMLDSIDMDSNKILQVGDGTLADDAINLGQLTTHDDDVDAHHAKYTDAQARAAVDNGTYLKLTGGTVSGLLTLSSGLTVSSGVSSFSGVAIFGDAVTIDNGTVGSPSFKFTGTNTGLYLRTSGNDGIGFSVDGGADADVVLTASGFVPIKAGLNLGAGGFPWDNIEVTTINGQPVSAYLNP